MKPLTLPWRAPRATVLPTAFYPRQWALLAMLAVLFYTVLGDGQLDRWLAGFCFDPLIQRFPLQHNWWLEHVNHVWLKNVSIMVGVAALGLGVFGPRDADATRRWRLACAAMLAGSLSVSWLKQMSPYHCPWDLLEFGGHAPYVPLLAALPTGVTAGKCFPAGHASGGFVLMALYFVYAGKRPRLARAWLWGGLALGLLMGIGQQLRGAHFLSHTLWSGWVVWAVMLGCHQGFGLRQRPAQDACRTHEIRA